MLGTYGAVLCAWCVGGLGPLYGRSPDASGHGYNVGGTVERLAGAESLALPKGLLRKPTLMLSRKHPCFVVRACWSFADGHRRSRGPSAGRRGGSACTAFAVEDRGAIVAGTLQGRRQVACDGSCLFHPAQHAVWRVRSPSPPTAKESAKRLHFLLCALSSSCLRRLALQERCLVSYLQAEGLGDAILQHNAHTARSGLDGRTSGADAELGFCLCRNGQCDQGELACSCREGSRS